MARVLVVDDALMMRKTIGNFLQRGGHEVAAEGADGLQAVALYKKHHPEVTTLDITMPESDGIEALTQIMAYDSTAKVIMVSSLGQKHKVFEALQKGARSYLLKPFTEDKLLATLKDVLQMSTEAGGVCCAGARPAKFPEAGASEAASFSIKQESESVLVTAFAEFSPGDFCDLAKELETLLQEKQKQFVFQYTQGNALQSKTVSGFLQLMEQVVRQGAALRVECFVQDYTRYFRSAAALQSVDWGLVKKKAV